MQTVKDKLHHRHDGLTIAAIASATEGSTEMDSYFLGRARTAEISWQLPDGVSRAGILKMRLGRRAALQAPEAAISRTGVPPWSN